MTFENVSFCLKCQAMTHTVERGRGFFVCIDCSAPKELGELFRFGDWN